MGSKRFLFDVLTGHGHINPTLPLVTELVRRGHRVDYATAAEHADAVVAAGANWVELPPLPPFRPPGAVGMDAMTAWFRHYFAAMHTTYPVLREHCATARPDVVCYDTTNWPGRVVAERLGVPGASLVPHFASNDHFSLTGAMSADTVLAALADLCADFSAEHGIPLEPKDTIDATEALNLVFIPREFQPHGETFDDRFAFVGPQLGNREQAEAFTPPDGDEPLLYVSLGTIFTDRPEFYRTCIEAFGSGDWRVAMTVGAANRTALGSVPSTVDVRERFPQLAVLRHARAFVSHTGMNSTMESLYYGVPLVAVPQMPEQVANASRVAELGLGTRLDPATVTAEELHAAVTALVADTDTRARLARMSTATRAAGGTGRAADILTAYSG